MDKEITVQTFTFDVTLTVAVSTIDHFDQPRTDLPKDVAGEITDALHHGMKYQNPEPGDVIQDVVEATVTPVTAGTELAQDAS